jgi:hypothetical protein
MKFQLSWETAPGLSGLRCDGFRAVATETPDTMRGVAIACRDAAGAEQLVRALEEFFRSKRFSNGAAAFESVKAFALDWEARESG